MSANLALTLLRGSPVSTKGLARSGPQETFMFIRFLFAAVSLCIAGFALAQNADNVPKPATLGKVAKVEGLVTVSDANGIRRVMLNDPVIDRTRYVTSSTGYVTLSMSKGCDIELKPNQALTIDGEKTCDALWALVGSYGGNSALVPFAVGGAAILLMGGGAGSQTSGPSNNGGSGGGDDGGGGNQPCGGNPAACISTE